MRLTPKAGAVLGVLVRAAGKLVTKAELFAAVWSDTIVGDDALTSCVQELRRALGDDAKQPRFIETRHRRGYLFVAPLVATQGNRPSSSGPEAGLSTIAVLPFADMSPERDLDSLCDGLAEELINSLSQIDGLQVAARTVSVQFRAPGADVREVSCRLGVGALLEGSVRQSGDGLRVTVQLVEAATGFHRWSRRYDLRLDDVFAVQDEITESVATALRGLVLGHREREAWLRHLNGSAAFECYLLGREHYPRLTRADLQTAREMLERAIELDGGYAPAWAGLATVHATLYEWFGARPDDLAVAERAGERALQLAPGLADAHVAWGFALSLMRRHDEATDHFEEATAINPDLFDAYYYFARACFARGEITRSADLFRKAADVRPEDFQSPILLAQSLRMLGIAGKAREANREGIRRAGRLLELNPLDNRALSLGSSALFTDGQTQLSRKWSERAIRQHPDNPTTLVLLACIRAKTNQPDQALDLLERVSAQGSGKRAWLERDPDFDSLRGHPRFARLLARLK